MTRSLTPAPWQEKSRHRSALRQQLQRLGVAEKEKRQLKDELGALRSKDKQLRGRIGQLEAILHKVETVSCLISITS